MAEDCNSEREQRPPSPSQSGGGSGGWTVALLLLGLAMIAVAVVFPQIDANRRMNYERQKLQRDLTQITRQAAANEAFLKQIERDPQLAERLAGRQMHFIPEGANLLGRRRSLTPASRTAEMAEVSPFALIRVGMPAPLAPYQPAGGVIGQWLLNSQVRLYGLAAGLFLVAAGLILGANGSGDGLGSVTFRL
jgi:hypothetical protein